MTLAGFEDANGALDETKISFANESDAADEARRADNVVRGQLGDVFPDQVALWAVAPAGLELPTPALVREAAALLMASYRYSKRYSEDDAQPNDYAEKLEKQAMQILKDIRDGIAILWDTDYGVETEAGYGLERDDFWPNDTYTPEFAKLERELDQALQPARSFAMDREY